MIDSCCSAGDAARVAQFHMVYVNTRHKYDPSRNLARKSSSREHFQSNLFFLPPSVNYYSLSQQARLITFTMSAPDNENNLKAGLEQITQEEHDEATSLFEALADPELTADLTSTLASDATAGPNSIDNVFYVNFNPKTENLPEAWRVKLDDVSKNVNLSHTFMNRKANQNVADAVEKGDISDKDPVKKANYLAKCLNVYTTSAPWCVYYPVHQFENDFYVDSFHIGLKC